MPVETRAAALAFLDERIGIVEAAIPILQSCGRRTSGLAGDVRALRKVLAR